MILDTGELLISNLTSTNMDPDNLALASQLISGSYVSQGGAALTARRKLIKALLSNKRLPQTGWDEATIEMLMQVQQPLLHFLCY